MNTKAGMHRGLRNHLKRESAETTKFCFSVFISAFLCANAGLNLSLPIDFHWSLIYMDQFQPHVEINRQKVKSCPKFPAASTLAQFPEVGMIQGPQGSGTELSYNRRNSGQGSRSPQSTTLEKKRNCIPRQTPLCKGASHTSIPVQCVFTSYLNG